MFLLRGTPEVAKERFPSLVSEARSAPQPRKEPDAPSPVAPAAPVRSVSAKGSGTLGKPNIGASALSRTRSSKRPWRSSSLLPTPSITRPATVPTWHMRQSKVADAPAARTPEGSPPRPGSASAKPRRRRRKR